ncbi:Exportin-4 [Nymphaea thermarum]|nr:Exportin-4 [Nymphaea thermarum]
MQGVPEGGDLARLHATMQAVEDACNSIQMHSNPSAAEATLVSLRQSSKPYQTCRFILENSHLANAKFQAASAIRDAAIREWGFLSLEEKQSLITYCLCFILRSPASSEAYVQAKVSAVGAQLMKRGWLEFADADKEVFLAEIKRAVLGVHGSDVQYAGINFLESLPGPVWLEILLSHGRVEWLLEFYKIMQQKFSWESSWIDSPLAVSNRQLIVQLCSLTGTIFPSDDGQTQEKHLLQMLSGIIQWIDPPDVACEAVRHGKSESELLDGFRALLAIATITSRVVFDKLLKSLRPYGTLTLLSGLTCEAIKARSSASDEEETWGVEAFDILMDIWTVLLEPTELSKNTPLPVGITEAAAVFGTILEYELKAAADSAYDEDDGHEQFRAYILARDDKLCSYALIGRAAAEMTIPLLLKTFSERVTLLDQGRGRTDPTRILEEIYWLLMITGHVLADAGDGETPLVPEALQAQFSDVASATQHPVVLLSSSILRFAERCLDPEMRASFFSPRLMEAVIWFLARWAATYLMPLDSGKGYSSMLGVEGQKLHSVLPSREILMSFCGEKNEGRTVLDNIIRIAITTLIYWTGEKNLQELTCFQLLPTLVSRRNICSHLVTLESWHELANSFVSNRMLFSMAGPLQRSLADALCRSACGMSTMEAANQYVRDLMGPVTSYLVDISTKNELKDVAQKADAIFMVSCLLERLRGAARATQPRTQRAIFDMGLSVMTPLLTLLEVYKNQSAVIYILLKFVVDLVDGQVVFLEPSDTAVLFSFCVRLLQIYSSHNIGKISLGSSSSLLGEAKTEKYKDLRALLQLLTNLCSKDLVDFSSSGEVESPNVAQYFSLLSHMLEVYPEKVAQLNPDAFGHIVASLDFGIHQQDIEVVNMSLTAVSALATYHYKERCLGKEGLGLHAAGYEDADGKHKEGTLASFLRSLLLLLLFEDYSVELVGSAADALLPLIACDPVLYQRLGHELIESQTDLLLRSRLVAALQNLTSSNQLVLSLDRANRQKFRKNLHYFLTEVCGFLRTI